jgi:arginine exporter protein ArgO
MFVSGVFLGSALWWLVLSWTVAHLRTRLSLGAMRWVNRISGAVIAGFGVVALAAVL